MKHIPKFTLVLVICTLCLSNTRINRRVDNDDHWVDRSEDFGSIPTFIQFKDEVAFAYFWVNTFTPQIDKTYLKCISRNIEIEGLLSGLKNYWFGRIPYEGIKDYIDDGEILKNCHNPADIKIIKAFMNDEYKDKLENDKTFYKKVKEVIPLVENLPVKEKVAAVALIEVLEKLFPKPNKKFRKN